MLWKSEMAEEAKEVEAKNRACPDTRSWTAKKILGKPPFNTLEAQMLFSPGLLAQVRQACLTSWKKLPPKADFSFALTRYYRERMSHTIPLSAAWLRQLSAYLVSKSLKTPLLNS